MVESDEASRWQSFKQTRFFQTRFTSSWPQFLSQTTAKTHQAFLAKKHGGKLNYTVRKSRHYNKLRNRKKGFDEMNWDTINIWTLEKDGNQRDTPFEYKHCKRLNSFFSPSDRQIAFPERVNLSLIWWGCLLLENLGFYLSSDGHHEVDFIIRPNKFRIQMLSARKTHRNQ